MSIRRRWILIGVGAGIAVPVIVAIVSLFVLGGNAEPESRPSLITVEEIINQVETSRPRVAGENIAEFLPAEIGQDLLPGDGVKTFLESETRIDIRLRGLIRIIRTTPNTIWRLGRFALAQNTIIELDRGKIFLLDESQQSDGSWIKIVTPAGTASPRGTWMSVEFDPDRGVTEVECFRGICELQNDLGVQVLTAEQKSTVTETTPPTEPVFLTPEEKIEFRELPEAQKGTIENPTPLTKIRTVTPTPTLAPSAPPIPKLTSVMVTAVPPAHLPSDTTTPEHHFVRNVAPNPSFEQGANVPAGWRSETKGIDAIFEWDERITRRGSRSLKVTATRSANQGLPGWETVAAIPIELGGVYEFSVWAYTEDKAIFWMDIWILDSAGRTLTGTSSGSIPLDQAGEWLQMTKALDTNHFKESYPNMAAVKLGLRLSLLYRNFGITTDTVTSIHFDDASFAITRPATR